MQDILFIQLHRQLSENQKSQRSYGSGSNRSLNTRQINFAETNIIVIVFNYNNWCMQLQNKLYITLQSVINKKYALKFRHALLVTLDSNPVEITQKQFNF